MGEPAFLQCMWPRCAERLDVTDRRFECPRCGGLMDVRYDWRGVPVPKSLSFFATRWSTPGRSLESRADFSGVWRFRELLPFARVDELVTMGEGRTSLQQADALAREIGHEPGRLFLQYEGFNPSGSFKDNGMAAAFTMARRLGTQRVACASTGNTSASLALYAAHTATQAGSSMRAVVFVGGDKIAFGKLAQALDYGALTLQIDGDFDTCMKLVQEAAGRLNLYLMNSINPFRLEGQKAIMYRVLEGLDWQVPDWIVVPGGNLGNTSAFGKAFMELRELGLVDRVPRLAVINAEGADTLDRLFNGSGLRFNGGDWNSKLVEEDQARKRAEAWHARTVATAIEIGRPVNLPKALRSLEFMNGVVRAVTDEDILDGKASVGRFGYGCEPASGASIAGLRRLLGEGVIAKGDRVICILTGHGLKDPNVTVDYHQAESKVKRRRTWANPPVRVPADLDAIARVLQ